MKTLCVPFSVVVSKENKVEDPSVQATEKDYLYGKVLNSKTPENTWEPKGNLKNPSRYPKEL